MEIASKSVLLCKKQNLVWGKVTGYPWWPGICIGTIETKKGVVLNVVNFVGDKSHARLPDAKMLPYIENRELYSRNAKGRLRSAIQNADELLKGTFVEETPEEARKGLEKTSEEGIT